MSADPRLARRGGLKIVEVPTVGSHRFLLCGRDSLRLSGFGGTASVLLTETDSATAPIVAAHSANSCLDGNRRSWMESNKATGWARLTLDRGSSDERMALLWLDYFDGDEVYPVSLESSESSTGPWSAGLSMTALYQDSHCSLWMLPIAGAVVSCGAGNFTDTVTFRIDAARGTDYSGWSIMPAEGPYAGQSRTILSWNNSSGYVTVDRPWDGSLFLPGRALCAMTLQRPLLNNLFARYVRIKLARRYSPGLLPIRLIGLSIFDYVQELRGDLGQFRRLRAPSPSGISRSSKFGYPHAMLTGGVRRECPFGPKRTLVMQWEAAYAGFHDIVEAWAGSGDVGIVDEMGRYLQGSVTVLSSDRLPRDMAGHDESVVRVEFSET